MEGLKHVPSAAVRVKRSPERISIQLGAILVSPHHVIPCYFSVVCSNIPPTLSVILLVVLRDKILPETLPGDAVYLGWNFAGFCKIMQ